MNDELDPQSVETEIVWTVHLENSEHEYWGTVWGDVTCYLDSEGAHFMGPSEFNGLKLMAERMLRAEFDFQARQRGFDTRQLELPF